MAARAVAVLLALGAAVPVRAGLREDCSSELSLLCSGAGSDADVSACLEENRSTLTPACRSALSGGSKPAPAPAPAEPQAPAAPTEDLSLEVVVKTKRAAYEIRGADAKALRAQMRALGPVSPVSGKRYNALTTSSTRWRYRYAKSPGSCALVTPTVTAEVVITLPVWVDADSAPEALRARWAAYAAGLEAHEDGHKDLIVKRAGLILAKLRGLGPRPSCEEMNKAGNEAGQALLGDSRPEHAAYDLATDHGRTTIPPL